MDILRYDRIRHEETKDIGCYSANFFSSYNAGVPSPVVLSNRGALYQPLSWVLKALYSGHHQNNPVTRLWVFSIVIRAAVKRCWP